MRVWQRAAGGADGGRVWVRRAASRAAWGRGIARGEALERREQRVKGPLRHFAVLELEAFERLYADAAARSARLAERQRERDVQIRGRCRGRGAR